MDSGQRTIASLSTHRLSHAQASFPTSHTVLSYEVNLVYLRPSRQLNWRLTDCSAYRAELHRILN
jgi:hypothetical protein